MSPQVVPSDSSDSGRSDGSGGERAVSAVIGVVLLLAVTVLLAAVVAPVMFGTISDFGSSSPDADFAFQYEQGTPLDLDVTADDFGTPVGAGQGLVSVQLQRGGSLDPANIEIRGSVSGGNLLENTSSSVYTADNRMEDGDIVTITAVRGETIRVIWTGDGGKESAILGEFTVKAPRDLQSNRVPEPDYTCEYVEDQLDGGESDVEVIGVVVECDLDRFYPRIDDITVESANGNLGAIIGEVNGTGDIDTDAGNTYEGTVESGTDGDDGDIDIKNGSNYYSDIVTKGDGDVDVDGESSVAGQVEATGAVSLQTSSSVAGEIRSGTDGDDGDIDISASRVGDNIFAEGNGSVDIDERSFVDGVIESVGTVDVQESSEVAGRILAGTGGNDGTVTVTASEVGGSITSESEGGIDISTDSAVGGEVVSVGAVDVQGDSEVGGRILAGTDSDDGTVTVSSSDIDGPITSESEGGVDIDAGSTVDGAVDSAGSADVQQGSDVLGGLTAEGDTTVNGGSTVGGDIVSNGTVTVTGGSTVDGGIEVTGGSSVDLSNAEVGGHISLGPSGTFSCDNSTILGKSCSEYRSPQYELNITGTNSPTTKGNDLQVDLLVENVGFNGDGDITLLVDGTEEKVMTVNIDRSNDNPQQLQFSWETDGASTGEHNVTVRSAVDTESTTVYITGENGPSFTVEGVDTDAEVYTHDVLPVLATVQNRGGENGSMEIRLQDFDGQTVDSTSPYIEDGSKKQVLLEWTPGKSDIGTGEIAVDTNADTDRDTAEVDVLEDFYEIEDVQLYPAGGKGKDIDTELFLNLSDDGSVKIEAVDKNDNTVDERTVNAVSDVYRILENQNAKGFNGEVVVTLYDANGDKRDTAARDWGSGNGGGGGGGSTTADSVETVDGTTPGGESSFLEFDVEADLGESARVTDVEVTKPANQNPAVSSVFTELRSANPEVYLDPASTSGADQTGQYAGVYTVGTLQSLDTDAVFSDGSVLSVRLGRVDGGSVKFSYSETASESDTDITVALQFDDGSSHETHLKVTKVNS